eukprot:COSAG05_NODE_12386_length_470_cov_0.679245_1_plen_86_part_01
MQLGPSGSKTPCHICKQVHGRHSQFYKDGRDAAKPYRNPAPVYSEFPGHTIHADSAYWDCESIEGYRYTPLANFPLLGGQRYVFGR